jgi:hypothetical protein
LVGFASDGTFDRKRASNGVTPPPVQLANASLGFIRHQSVGLLGPGDRP